MTDTGDYFSPQVVVAEALEGLALALTFYGRTA